MNLGIMEKYQLNTTNTIKMLYTDKIKKMKRTNASTDSSGFCSDTPNRKLGVAPDHHEILSNLMICNDLSMNIKKAVIEGICRIKILQFRRKGVIETDSTTLLSLTDKNTTIALKTSIESWAYAVKGKNKSQIRRKAFVHAMIH